MIVEIRAALAPLTAYREALAEAQARVADEAVRRRVWDREQAEHERDHAMSDRRGQYRPLPYIGLVAESHAHEALRRARLALQIAESQALAEIEAVLAKIDRTTGGHDV
jgi:hypothetical protein